MIKNKNYIAFSLWGDKPDYTIGAIRNVVLAKTIYPEWDVVIYYDHTVPQDIIAQLKQQGAFLQDMTRSGIYGLFWRFLAADLPDCARAIFRDTDSRLSVRERNAVNEWIANGDVLHIMRDHPFHQVPYGANGLSILGGMWGIKGGVLNMEALIRNFLQGKKDEYGLDQTYLQSVYLRFNDSQTVHDEFFEKKPFPSKRKGYQFIGERIDEHDQPIGDDREALKNHLRRQRPKLLRRIKRFFAS